MNWPWKKKKLSFAETAKFNWEADTNEELRRKLNELAKQYPTLREQTMCTQPYSEPERVQEAME